MEDGSEHFWSRKRPRGGAEPAVHSERRPPSASSNHYAVSGKTGKRPVRKSYEKNRRKPPLFISLTSLTTLTT